MNSLLAALLVILAVGTVEAAVSFPSLRLFFDQPALSTLRGSSKKVFAHYFAPYPISLDNASPELDYYQRNYLKPEGENGKFASSGGLLRDRPFGRAPLTGDYKLQDAITELKWAVASGIDGFSYDVLSLGTSQSGTATLDRLLTAIPMVDPAFRILLVPDMTATAFLAANVDANFQPFIKKYWANSYVYKIDGKLVISPFIPERMSLDWWTTNLNQLAAAGYPCLFIPMFLNWSNFNTYKSISYGASSWGDRTPYNTLARSKIEPSQAHAAGKLYMAPVGPQDYRPKSASAAVREAINSFQFRTAWECAMNTSAEWVQVVTWSDYSEHSHVVPSVGTQYGFFDLMAYYVSWFKTGVKPQIKRDAIYYFHRNQHAVLDHTYAQQVDMTVVGGMSSLSDKIEMLAYLTAPATLKIKIGSTEYTRDVPAGAHSFMVPVSEGTPVFSIIRNSVTVLSATSNTTILANSAIYTSDFTYRAGGVTATAAASTPAPSAKPTAAPTRSPTLASTKPPTSKPTAAPTSVPLSSLYIGCYATSPSSPDLIGASTTNAAMTIQICLNFCASSQYSYAGVDNTKCTCDNTYGSNGASTGCIKACPGDSTQICGDQYGYRNSVYRAVAV